MPTLIIGNKNYSSWSLRPWILLKHYQVGFSEKRIALFADTMQAELTPYGSDGKVPVLQTDEGHNIWDSLAILEYISEQYLDNQGWPKKRYCPCYCPLY
jgi:glutathione S-transferase